LRASKPRFAFEVRPPAVFVNQPSENFGPVYDANTTRRSCRTTKEARPGIGAAHVWRCDLAETRIIARRAPNQVKRMYRSRAVND
jgi:hypothetical protein